MDQIPIRSQVQTIIAAGTDGETHVDQLVSALRNAGIADQNMGTAVLNPPGQHATHSIGGDMQTDEGAKAAAPNQRKGIAIGAAAGAAVGLAVGAVTASAAPILGAATLPLIAAVGTGVGALIGAVAGTMRGLSKADDASTGNDELGKEPSTESSATPVRRGGLMLAVSVTREQEAAVVQVLRTHGAHDIERARGEWRDQTWVDFDPLSTPKLV